MLSFKNFLSENYKNFIGPSSIENRRKWSKQAWDLLQSSYQKIGGIKGSGFSSEEDMIQNIPFWKLYVKNEKVIAAAFYKDKNGRKIVAIATDGSEFGKKIVSDIFKASVKVSYGEKSGPALSTFMKQVPWTVAEKLLIDTSRVKQLSKDQILTLDEFGVGNLDANDKFTYDKFPELRPYMYIRELGKTMKLKVMIGTPGLPIK